MFGIYYIFKTDNDNVKNIFIERLVFLRARGISDIRTTIILSAYKTWSDISKEERVQACYQHACLKYLSNEMLTNKSLRERLGVDEKNYPAVSLIIKEALSQGLIKVGTPDGTNRRDIAYIPNWG